MPHDMRPTSVNLVGGLGNQLFQYCAGVWLSTKNDTSLVIDFSRIGHGGTNHGKSLLEFNLPNVDLRDIPEAQTQFGLLIRRLDSKLRRQISWYNRLVMFFSHTYHSPVIGYDANLEKLSSGVTINGYFQSWRYYDSLKIQFELCAPSKEFGERVSKIREQQAIAVHIRRGDYNELLNSFGVLSADYYSNAIKLLDAKYGERPIVVFSDSLNEALPLLELAGYGKSRISYFSNSLSPAEELMLMSACSFHVISNSTFSWWGATLSKNSKLVVCPEKWFRGLPDPVDLIPSNWFKITSSWV